MYVPLTRQEVIEADKLAENLYLRGHYAELDQLYYHEGRVSITAENIVADDGTFVTIEFHKLSDGTGFFGGQKSKWVSRLLTHPTKEQENVTTHGCYEAPTIFHAFHRATTDVGRYLSQTKLEDYF